MVFTSLDLNNIIKSRRFLLIFKIIITDKNKETPFRISLNNGNKDLR